MIGAATAGYDALGRHAFGVEAGWNVSRLRPDWQAVYAYDRWWPTLLADVSDDTDPWRGGEMRTREANVGALFPIPLQPQCVVCHGKPEQLAEGVAAALAKRYPDDAATGFAPGELRGWFWVEVP